MVDENCGLLQLPLDEFAHLLVRAAAPRYSMACMHASDMHKNRVETGRMRSSEAPDLGTPAGKVDTGRSPAQLVRTPFRKRAGTYDYSVIFCALWQVKLLSLVRNVVKAVSVLPLRCGKP